MNAPVLFQHSLIPDGLNLYLLNLRVDAKIDDEILHTLSHAEKTHMGNLVHYADRVRFAVTRSTLRRLLARRIGCAPEDVRLSSDSNGKPFLLECKDGGGDVSFNVSHSGKKAIIAIASGHMIENIGVDIEEVQQNIEWTAISPIVFTPVECSTIRSSAIPVTSFFQHWSAKEAVLKAIGDGIAGNLQLLAVRFEPPFILVETAVEKWARFRGVMLPGPEGYATALAWQTKAEICE